MAVTVLIPALNPETSLLDVVDALGRAEAVDRILVVDDGSDTDHHPVFQDAARRAKTVVLRHAVNLGKGAALRTGINAFLCVAGRDDVVVTADADGQHLPGDILAVAAEGTRNPGSLVLGCRSFSGDVPWRSRFGNGLTRLIFKALLGRAVSDTQTGLRAIPRSLMPALLRSKARGYEFELEMLILAVRAGAPISSVTIQTVYLDDNKSSHFNPLLDSMRIYFVFARFLSSSAIAAIIDNIVFAIVYGACHHIPAGMITGRVVAGVFNFILNRRYVFHSHAGFWRSFLRYALLVAVFGFIAFVLIDNLTFRRGWSAYAAKLVVEGALLIASFVFQRDVVFAVRPLSPPAEEADEDEA